MYFHLFRAISCTLLVMFSNTYLFSQNLKIFTRRDGHKVSFFVNNPHHCPGQGIVYVSNPEILVSESDKKTHYFTIEALKDSLFLFEVMTHPDSNTALKYKYNFAFGNPLQSRPDLDYPYIIPYEDKKKHWLIQGYNGKYSHKKQFALDFKMKEGSPVCAVREGIVIDSRQDSEKGGKGAEFSNLANYIIIYHPQDGTFAYYWHLKYQGVVVKTGNWVNPGDIIGFSGNTGWSTTPHLHFEIKKPVYMKMASIPSLFLNRKLKNRRLKPWRPYKSFHYR